MRYKYLDEKMKTPLKAVLFNRFLQVIGYGIFALFLPVYIYEVTGSFKFMFLYFMCLYGLQGILTPIGAMIMSRIGIRNCMIVSTPFVVVSYVFLLFLPVYPLIFASLSILTNVIWRALYWVPFHTDFALFSDKKQRARQISLFVVCYDILAIFIPLISGSLIFFEGFTWVITLTTIFYALSVIPLFFIPEVKETYEYGYIETFQELYSKKNRSLLFAFVAEGAEDIVGLIIWPLFIWLVLAGNYFQVGVLASFIVFVSIIINLFVGNATDKHDKNLLLKYGSMTYAIGWIFKIFVTSAFQIFLVSLYHQLTIIFHRRPYDTIMYEKAADAGHYVDEYSVMREVSLNFGRVLVLIFLFVTYPFLPLTASFIFAAVAAIVMIFISKYQGVDITVKSRVIKAPF